MTAAFADHGQLKTLLSAITREMTSHGTELESSQSLDSLRLYYAT